MANTTSRWPMPPSGHVIQAISNQTKDVPMAAAQDENVHETSSGANVTGSIMWKQISNHVSWYIGLIRLKPALQHTNTHYKHWKTRIKQITISTLNILMIQFNTSRITITFYILKNKTIPTADYPSLDSSIHPSPSIPLHPSLSIRLHSSIHPF